MTGLKPQCVIVMGVSGSGKSTVGVQLASRLEADFYDGDDLHPAANIEKMSAGIALTDDDRWPWLDIIRHKSSAMVANNQSVVIACSALKLSYRLRLAQDLSALRFVYLYGSRELITQRQSARTDHFMPAALVDSQFATLEGPRNESNVVTVNIDQSIKAIVDQCVSGLGQTSGT